MAVDATDIATRSSNTPAFSFASIPDYWKAVRARTLVNIPYSHLNILA